MTQTYKLTTWVHAGGVPGVIHQAGTEVEFLREEPGAMAIRWIVRRVGRPSDIPFAVMPSTLRPVSIVERIGDLDA